MNDDVVNTRDLAKLFWWRNSDVTAACHAIVQRNRPPREDEALHRSWFRVVMVARPRFELTRQGVALLALRYAPAKTAPQIAFAEACGGPQPSDAEIDGALERIGSTLVFRRPRGVPATGGL
jgi:hypothetical protein